MDLACIWGLNIPEPRGFPRRTRVAFGHGFRRVCPQARKNGATRQSAGKERLSVDAVRRMLGPF